MLCEVAKKRKIPELYDNIAISNLEINMFLQYGFQKENRTEEIIMLKKVLLKKAVPVMDTAKKEGNIYTAGRMKNKRCFIPIT